MSHTNPKNKKAEIVIGGAWPIYSDITVIFVIAAMNLGRQPQVRFFCRKMTS